MTAATVHAFDFDGTLTCNDTFLEFIIYDKGMARFLWGFLVNSPWIVLMLLRLYPNWKAKERVFSHFYKGTPLADFDRRCRKFGASKKSRIMRPAGLKCVAQALEAGQRVLVVSASIENWVRAFFTPHPGLTILGTQVEVAGGRLTGRFLTKNCYGQEKVRRVMQMLPQRDNYILVAYGDSRGDKELLDYADVRHYKPFREGK